MSYRSLTKIYYQNINDYESSYISRYNSFGAKHFDLCIKQYNHQVEYPMFFNFTEDITLLTEKIYKSYEKLLYVVHSVPDVVLQQFSLLSILEEVKSTNDIEGVHSTRKELKKILDGEASKTARFSSIVHRYSSLLANEEILFKTCQDIRFFYDDFTHKELSDEDPSNKLDGEIFRKDPVDITSASGKTIHRGITPESKILNMMDASLTILHDESIPFLVRISLFHYLFAYIHPFYDGNGRTIRFITSYYLSKHFHKIVALRLSVLIKKNRSKYYSLFTETDSELNRADLTPFITGFLQLLLTTFEDTISNLERKQKQLEIYKNKINNLHLEDELLNNIYYILLQAALFYGQGISITDLATITNKSRGTIQGRLEKIPEPHVLSTRNKKTNYYKLNLLMFK